MRSCRNLLSALVCLASAQGAITGVRVVGATATQAVIEYTAPGSSACTMEVSESSTYAPLVHDVDPALFAGSNSDARPGNLTDGGSRVFVVGKRTAEMSTDNKYYSRALQVYTNHYYRIACGQDVATGSFWTANLAPSSFGDPYPVDRAHPGNWAWPTMDWWGGETDLAAGTTGTVIASGATATFSAGHGLVAGDVIRVTSGWQAGEETQIASFQSANVATLYRPFYINLTSGTTCPAAGCAWVKRNRDRGNSRQTIIDPLTGLLIRRLTAPNESFYNYNNGSQALASASGANWSVGGGAATLAAAITTAGDGATANWTGDGASGPGDWLHLYISPFSTSGTVNSIDALRVVFTGTCSGGCQGDDAQVEVCIADATQAGCRSAIQDIDITQAACTTTTGCNLADQYRVLKFWLSPTNPLGTLLSGNDFVTDGVLVRKKTRTAGLTLSLDKATIFTTVHPGTSWFVAGFAPGCSPQTVAQTYNGITRPGYMCYTPDYRLYWVEPVSGDTALITNLWGNDTFTGQNRWNTGYTPGAFDPQAANVWYATVPYTSGGAGVLKLTYTGDYLDIGPTDTSRRVNYDIVAQELTPKTTLQNLVQSFSAGQLEVFDPNLYGGCGLAGWVDNYLKLICYPTDDAQDGLGWIVVFDPAAKAVVAATSTHSVYPMRYGGLHSVYSDQSFGGWVMMTNDSLAETPNTHNGAGPLQTEVQATLNAPGPVGGDPQNVACPAILWGRGTTGNVNQCSQIQVTGDIYDPSPGTHENSNRGSAGFLGPLQAAAPGDIFSIDTERVQLVAKSACAPADPCNWTLLRAIDGTTAAQHAAGAPLFGLSVSPGSSNAKLFWNYVADPHGVNPTGAEILYAPQGSHPNATQGQLFFGNSGLGGAWNEKSCPTTVPSCWVKHEGTAPQMSAGTDTETYVADSARFANQPVYTGYTDSHLSHLLPTPWILDGRPADQNISGAQSWTQQASGLYKTTTGITSIKSLPLEGICSKKLLVDVSPGPIDPTTSGSYTMCVGSGCWAGAGGSDIYVNCPDLTAASVTCSAWTDLCVYSTSSNLHQYQQADMTQTDTMGKRVRNLGDLLSRDAFDTYKNMRALGTDRALYRILNGDGVHDEMALVKLPPLMFDNINRTTFFPIQVQVGAVPAGTDNVVAEFGYDTSFYCTSRQEACEAAASTVNESNPFYWASETYTGVRTAPLTIAIPAIPQRVLYYRLKYRDASNAVLKTGPTEVVVSP